MWFFSNTCWDVSNWQLYVGDTKCANWGVAAHRQGRRFPNPRWIGPSLAMITVTTIIHSTLHQSSGKYTMEGCPQLIDQKGTQEKSHHCKGAKTLYSKRQTGKLSKFWMKYFSWILNTYITQTLFRKMSFADVCAFVRLCFCFAQLQNHYQGRYALKRIVPIYQKMLTHLFNITTVTVWNEQSIHCKNSCAPKSSWKLPKWRDWGDGLRISSGLTFVFSRPPSQFGGQRLNRAFFPIGPRAPNFRDQRMKNNLTPKHFQLLDNPPPTIKVSMAVSLDILNKLILVLCQYTE